GDANATGPAADGRGVELAEDLRPGAGGVLGDVHDRHAVPRRVGDRLLRVPEHAVQVPVLGILSYGARADEGRGLDPEPGLLRDVDDGIDVGLERARRAVGLDRELG